MSQTACFPSMLPIPINTMIRPMSRRPLAIFSQPHRSPQPTRKFSELEISDLEKMLSSQSPARTGTVNFRENEIVYFMDLESMLPPTPSNRGVLLQTQNSVPPSSQDVGTGNNPSELDMVHSSHQSNSRLSNVKNGKNPIWTHP